HRAASYANRSRVGEQMPRIVPVLLSGGSGTRLWPVSRSLYPKQLLPMTSDRTMFQETARRFDGAPEFGAPLVVCNHVPCLHASQVPAVGIAPRTIVLEPIGRNTAPAAAVASLLLADQPPDTLMLLAPSDHVIDDVPGFLAAVKAGARAATQGHLVTFGI